MVRRIATELRPGVLDHLGLAAALEWQANEFQTRTGIKCEVRIHLRDQTLSPDLNTTLFRIFQETLTNIIRHAGATQVEVDLRESAGRIILEVRDNGRGISDEEISNTQSMGLLGMRERAALLGGTFEIGPGPRGRGTKVAASIPLHKAGGKKAMSGGDEDYPPQHQNHDPEHEDPHIQDQVHENSVGRRSRRSAARAEANSRR
jgi:signal transduction histidine kinase